MITIDQAHDAIDDFDALLYFDKVKPHIRAKIADVLVALCNMPPNDRRERNGHGEQIRYVPPMDRLKRFTRILTTKMPGGAWPGLSQMIALYNEIYVPADPQYAVPCGSCTIEGFTSWEQEAGVDALAEERTLGSAVYLPQPGDEPIDKEYALIAQAAKRLTRGGE